MATYYIDPTWTGTASGTFALPWTTYTSLPALNPGDVVLQKENTVFLGRLTAGSSGTAASPIIYGVYYSTTGAQVLDVQGAATIRANGDGTSAAIASGSQAYVTFWGLKAENAGAAAPLIRLGKSTYDKDGCFAKYCVANNSLASGISAYCCPGPVGSGVSYSTCNNNAAEGFIAEGSASFFGLICDFNTLSYNTGSGFRWGPYNINYVLNGTSSVSNNVCVGNTLHGIRFVGDVKQCKVWNNTCRQNLIGIYVGVFIGGNEINYADVSGNVCNNNLNFGIQTGRAKGFNIHHNICNNNGAATNNGYGRGIEIFGAAAGLTSGRVAYNTCNGNLNFGGTVNNGTEGVGIGLDDYHENVLCIGNICCNNEGSGIQPNPNGAAGTSYIVGNVLIDNFKKTNTNSGTWTAPVLSAIYTGTTEANLKIWNNTIINTGPSIAVHGICEGTSASASGVEILNNLIVGFPVAMKVRTSVARTNNAFWSNTVNVQEYNSTTTLDNGTGAVVVNPQLLPDYRPGSSSPLIAAGVYIRMLRDALGNVFDSTPSIGAYEISTVRGAR